MKKIYSLVFVLAFCIISGCSSSSTETKKALQTYYRDCSVMEYNAYEHDFYEIIQVWGLPTDTLYSGEKAAKVTKNYGADDCWNEIAYAWSDTSKVKVEGKELIKLTFDAEKDSIGNFIAVKGAHATYVQCFPVR